MKPRGPVPLAWHRVPLSAQENLPTRHTHSSTVCPAAGFTLVEMMIVVAMIAIFMTIGMPSIYNALHRTHMQQALYDLEEAFRSARMQAIMRGKPAEVVIVPQDDNFSYIVTVRMSPAPDPAEMHAGGNEQAGSPEEPGEGQRPAAASVPTFPSRRSQGVGFKALLINLKEVGGDQMEARVRFYPNGTSDAMYACLVSDANEERSVTLEITTGRSTVEVIR